MAAVPWIRWIACMAVLLAMRAPQAAPPATVACSSGEHAWWVSPAGDGRWSVLHTARAALGEAPALHEAASFTDEPVALAAEGDRVWVLFRAVGGRSETLTGEAARNPASGLMFMRPAGLRLCASLPVARLESVAAHQGTLWALEARGGAWRLRGERWEAVALPDEAMQAERRALAGTGDELWLVAASDGGARTRRWRSAEGGWQSAALESPAWRSIVTGTPRLAFEALDGAVGTVQQGAWVRECEAPEGAVVLGWGDGFVALQAGEGVARFATADLAHGGFGQPIELPPQRSNAARWFHLPILGVLSLGAVMAAVLVRGAALVRGLPKASGPTPMPLGRRLLALAVDAAPAAGAALVAFDAELDRLVVPPLWSTDLSESLPFVAMVVGTVIFGALEEGVGARSLGKKLMGGVVVREQGERAELWRHAVRNLLKALVMLSPVLALPVFASRRRQGLPEAVTDTVVAQA